MSRYIVELAASAGLLASLNGRDPGADARIADDSLVAWLRHADTGLDTGPGSDPDEVDLAPRIQDDLQAPPIRHIHAERDFGIGYGNSSGYGTERHYVNDWNPPRFRFV